MQADVCLIVEGTYPYVTGGVSSWLHALITNLQEMTFSVVHLAGAPDQELVSKYQMPANVLSVTNHYIHGHVGQDGPNQKVNPTVWQDIEQFHTDLAAHDYTSSCEFVEQRAKAGMPSTHSMVHGEQAWQVLLERYGKTADPSTSFLDYFWTYRFTHLPLFRIIDAELPPARSYHAISTGYAGVVGAMAKHRTGSPFLITEHGIYTREREIEIAQASWIYAENSPMDDLVSEDFFREWWKQMFRWMSAFSYRASDCTTSLTRINQRYQLRDGAPQERCMVIPNGIDLQRFSVERRADPAKFTVAFVGRVVSIKDVKTFVQAIAIARQTIGDSLQVFVVGPDDEEETYAEECFALTELLGLKQVITYTGRANVIDYYKTADVLVLTSLSEAQPLVILEASCAGIPVVSTDVGACRELLEGGEADDVALGPSGLLTPPASPRATAEALVTLWQQPELRVRMAAAGQERVRRYYRQEDMYKAYREMYGRFLPASTGTVGA